MKKITIPAILASILFVSSCAMNVTTETNKANKRYFDAWMAVNHPELVDQSRFPGYYVLEEVEGTGDLISLPQLTPYLLAEYRVTALDGSITSSSYESDAYKLRTHSSVDYYHKVDPEYYGPIIFDRQDQGLPAALEYAVQDMHEGGMIKLIAPGWTLTNDRYDTEDEYYQYCSGTDGIYTFHIHEGIQDISQWESDSVGLYISRRSGFVSDTAGFYMKTLTPGDLEFENDTTFYINYIGRRLDGVVFDTNIADTAKMYGLWSSSGTYEPTLINWTSDFSEITMTSDESSVVTGFALMLSKMKNHEKSLGVFTSEYGYSSTGAGNLIPSYSPLMFEIEIVEKED